MSGRRGPRASRPCGVPLASRQCRTKSQVQQSPGATGVSPVPSHEPDPTAASPLPRPSRVVAGLRCLSVSRASQVGRAWSLGTTGVSPVPSREGVDAGRAGRAERRLPTTAADSLVVETLSRRLGQWSRFQSLDRTRFQPVPASRHGRDARGTPLHRLLPTADAAHGAKPQRPGFTMVELLISMAIVAILASMVLFAMAAAQESAREGKTKATIATLHSIVMEQYDSYRTRRVPVDTSSLSPQAAAQERLKAVRRLMLREMPDHWDEVYGLPVPDNIDATAVARAYAQYKASNAPTSVYQGAECLYMIVMLSNPDAASMFSQKEIGDVDRDGAMEFLDGWGMPINFLRWPAGFVSNAGYAKAPVGFYSELQSGDAQADHDPFDSLRQDDDAYRLVPLIYSGGPDGEYDIVAGGTGTADLTNPDPYREVGNAGFETRVGTPYNDSTTGDTSESNWHDNIHNHLIGTR